MLVAPRDAITANRIPAIFITLNDGPMTIAIPKKVIKKRIFTSFEFFLGCLRAQAPLRWQR